MKNILAIFFNILLVTVFFISLVILYTENVTSFDKKIIDNIETQLDNTLDATTSIDSIKILWSGTKPRILITDLELANNKNQVILKTPYSELEIDIVRSLQTGKIVVGKFTIYDTSIDLKQNDTNISFNNLNLLKKTSEPGNIDIPLIVINNSTLRVKNEDNKHVESFKVNNFVASFENELVNINARFLHSSSTDPITLIFKGRYGGKGLESKIFLSANSIKLPYDILPASIRKLDTERMSVRIWISMIQTKVKKVVGNISSESLSIKLNQEALNIKNINSDLVYIHNNTSNILSLMRMNYNIKGRNINNNKIVISKNIDDDIRIYVKKSDDEILRLLTKDSSYKNLKSINKYLNSDISNLQVHLTKYNSIDYFSLSVENLDITYRDKFFVTNIAAEIYGTMNAGRINIKNSNIESNNIAINQLSGSISYNTKGKSIYFNSSNFKNKQGHNISLTGNQISNFPSVKIQISTTLNKIISSISSKKLDSFESNAIVKSNIYFHNGSLFTTNKIKDFYFKIQDSIYFSTDEIDIFTSSNMVSSKGFNLTLNNQNQYSKINTNTNSQSHQYTLTSIGNIEAKTLQKLFSLDNKTFDGNAKFKSIFSYDYNTQKASVYSSSDLDGVTLKTIRPWYKEKNTKADFVLNYQYFPKKAYPLKINLDKNEFEFKYSDSSTYVKIKSEAARGILKYPDSKSKNKNFTGSFEFIDMTYFSGGVILDVFPAVDIQSKHVKTANTVFDNVHLIMSPNNEYIEINKFNFKNINLEMRSKGKWYTKDNQRTEIVADVKSDNFGKALKGIGYPNTIKGGKMNANINCKWNGSLEDFSFSSSNGKIKLNIKEGQINELDKGTQAIGQVLGLFSIASIPKRLSLDFSDFFSKGLSFDDLESEIILASGIADTKKMTIVGSFGEMRLSGKSDLIKRTHNQTLIFIPDLSSTSLVTGAVIGGPIGAAASIFYDKLLKEFGVDTNKLAGIEYSIKGPWNNPEIKVTQSFKPIIN